MFAEAVSPERIVSARVKLLPKVSLGFVIIRNPQLLVIAVPAEELKEVTSE